MDILVNEVNPGTFDVVLPNGRIYITLFRDFSSVQEIGVTF